MSLRNNIRKVLRESLKDEMIKLINDYGIVNASRYVGGFDPIKDILGKKFIDLYEYIDKNMEKRGGFIDLRGYDYDKDNYDENLIWFYFKDTVHERDVIFEYIYKEYWEEKLSYSKSEDEEEIQRFLDKIEISPYIVVRKDVDDKFFVTLNDVFGELWKEPFKEWFKFNYPQFPVKTIIFE